MSATIQAIIEVFDEKASSWSEYDGDCRHYDCNGLHNSEPFQYMGSSLTAFIGGVRNFAHIPENFEVRGLPEPGSNGVDEIPNTSPFSFWGGVDSTHYPEINSEYLKTWLTLKELVDFDYDKTFEDRTSKSGDLGFRNSEVEGEGVITTYRDFLGSQFIKDIEIISKYADKPEHVRIIFGLF